MEVAALCMWCLGARLCGTLMNSWAWAPHLVCLCSQVTSSIDYFSVLFRTGCCGCLLGFLRSMFRSPRRRRHSPMISRSYGYEEWEMEGPHGLRRRTGSEGMGERGRPTDVLFSGVSRVRSVGLWVSCDNFRAKRTTEWIGAK